MERAAHCGEGQADAGDVVSRYMRAAGMTDDEVAGAGANQQCADPPSSPPSDNDDTTQRETFRRINVTVRALEDVEYITWPMETLESFLLSHSHLRDPVNALVGSDVARKLFRQTHIHQAKERRDAAQLSARRSMRAQRRKHGVLAHVYGVSPHVPDAISTVAAGMRRGNSVGDDLTDGEGSDRPSVVSGSAHRLACVTAWRNLVLSVRGAGELPEDDLMLPLALASVRLVRRRHAVLQEQGEEACFLHFVVEGSVSLLRQTGGGRDASVITAAPLGHSYAGGNASSMTMTSMLGVDDDDDDNLDDNNNGDNDGIRGGSGVRAAAGASHGIGSPRPARGEFVAVRRPAQRLIGSAGVGRFINSREMLTVASVAGGGGGGGGGGGDSVGSAGPAGSAGPVGSAGPAGSAGSAGPAGSTAAAASAATSREVPTSSTTAVADRSDAILLTWDVRALAAMLDARGGPLRRVVLECLAIDVGEKMRDAQALLGDTSAGVAGPASAFHQSGRGLPRFQPAIPGSGIIAPTWHSSSSSPSGGSSSSSSSSSNNMGPSLNLSRVASPVARVLAARPKASSSSRASPRLGRARPRLERYHFTPQQRETPRETVDTSAPPLPPLVVMSAAEASYEDL
jgi:CRP-like cAMP-binding protein